jgi:hypothetical protein
MNTLIVDIETAPLAVIPEAPASALDKGLGNLKDPAKIAAKQKTNLEGWTGKAALDYRKGQVIAVGILDVTLAENTIVEDCIEIITEREAHGETGLLTSAMDRLKLGHIVGFNVWDFDLTFLVGRCWMNGVAIADRFKGDALERPYPPGTAVTDLARKATFGRKYDPTGWSLDYYAEAWGFEAQPYGSGADVPDWYKEKAWTEIATHLRADLLMTYEMWNKVK